MIRCLPIGICSWNYQLEGDGHWAKVGYDWGERGEIIVDGTRLWIEKLGIMNSSWWLKSGDRDVAVARKTSIFSRTFEGSGPAGEFRLVAHSGFGRTMLLTMPGTSGAVISPDHAFTRRATITGDVSDFTTLCFGFWLTGLMWRRAARRR